MPLQSPAHASRMTDLQFLYESLQDFKGNASFQQYGFGMSSPYHWWLETLDGYREHEEEVSFLEEIAAGDLRTLGIEYAVHHGQETEVSKFLQSAIKESLYSE